MLKNFCRGDKKTDRGPSLIQLPLFMVSPIDPCVSRVPSGGAAGRKLLFLRRESIPFLPFFQTFFHPAHNTLIFI